MQTTADGTWRLRFYDVWGEDWVTDPITFNGNGVPNPATFVKDCATLVTMLESIPNDVIDESTVTCLKTDGMITGTPDLYWVKYELKFTGNPGAHKVPEIIVMDDAGRHTLRELNTPGTEYTGLDTTVVYDTGITGEFHDFFGKKCGVTVSIVDPATFYESDTVDGGYGLTQGDGVLEIHYGEVQRATVASGTLRTLKECLSDSDGVPSNNVGVENWDSGSKVGIFPQFDALGTARTIPQAVPGQFPHLVKLVNANADSEFEGGMHTIMSWHPQDDNFVLSAAVDPGVEYQV